MTAGDARSYREDMSAVRPTPADPTPGLTSARGGGDQRAVPPEPGPDSLAVLSGSLGVRRPRLVADGFH
ncbi:hypothetical protein D7193_28720 [Micromonospora costi]|uniref:Uncharacterized protein n=2 Tax=Micromonospora costi TaxID=1530042 RepID=A0A3A9ZUJ2_9ACTN|nr:hypothetical protein D7193_28720 [Micromonospora costi]